jgi:phosphatidylglycerol---prolipoprotein diacylglyceryl transferase
MHRYLISDPWISTYSFCLVLGFIGGFLLARWNARRARIEGRHIDNITLILVIAGLAGARFFSWTFYSPPGAGFWKTMTTIGGGLVFYGGVVFGVVAVIIYSRVWRLQLLQLMDVLAAPLALGLALGRLGCFFAGCCWGDVCVDPHTVHGVEPATQFRVQTLPLLSPAAFPLAVRFPENTGAWREHRKLGLTRQDATESLPVHPVQLYEAVAALLLVWALQRRRSRPGQTALAFCFGYGVIRFTLEFFRADNSPILLALTLSQWISLAAILVWLAVKLALASFPSQKALPSQLPEAR